MKTKSWKTTFGGLLTSVGIILTQIQSPEWLPLLGAFLASSGAALTGLTARDNQVTSEQANAK